MAREGALWMGDLADYMDENFIIAAFRALGEENVQNVKVMKNRYTGHPAGYCFVNFSSDQAALTAMHKLNGKVIPHSQPVLRKTCRSQKNLYLV
ncbi:tRNA selenocysteine 1-associated protein 1-like [Penaeus indicus]|uniref:tRNA selenocysteine 1-associated protein 1-like n=1 Tax=Penaeus indicus TaxID=29960 RepID=UPI00300CD1A1